MAEATIPLKSVRLPGTIMVLFSLASLPNSVEVLLGHLEIGRFLAAGPGQGLGDLSNPFGGRLGHLQNFHGPAFGLVDPFYLFALREKNGLSPVALGRLRIACFSPSDLAISARFSRSAFICFSMASSTVRGGWISLIS